MDYKLVCIDIDGTLLNSRHKVTEITKEALRKAHSTGVHIVISTGRMYTDAEYYSNLIGGINSPVIASNGAFIKEKHHDKVIYKSILGEKLCLEILNLSYKFKLDPIFCTPHKLYCGNILLWFFFTRAKLKNIVSKSMEIHYVHSKNRWNSIIDSEKDNIVKCEFIHKDKTKLKKMRDELINIGGAEIVNSFKYNIEITSKGTSKGRAVEMLVKHFNLTKDEVITIGDSANDISMIEYAGLGIAMGNAPDMVKQKADFITDINDNDGVAKAISKFILKE